MYIFFLFCVKLLSFVIEVSSYRHQLWMEPQKNQCGYINIINKLTTVSYETMYCSLDCLVLVFSDVYVNPAAKPHMSSPQVR